MKKSFFLATAFLINLTNFAQQITGKIIDNELEEPIPFVNVLLSENKGTITNSEGFFRIDADAYDASHVVTFSSMGFEEVQKTIAELQEDSLIILIPSNELLDQVVVSDRQLTALEIIEKFNENREKNHQLGEKRYRLFYRNRNYYKPEQTVFQLRKASNVKRKERKAVNETMKEIDEEVAGSRNLSFTESLRDLYTKDTLAVDLKEKIYLADSDVKDDLEEYQSEAIKKIFSNFTSDYGFKVKLGIIKLTDSLDVSREDGELVISSENSEDEDEEKEWNKEIAIREYPGLAYTKPDQLPAVLTDTKYYEYELEESTLLRGRPQYVIRFEPDKRKGKFEGKMYIDQEDYAVTQIDYSLAEGKSAFKLNLKLLGIKVDAFKAEKSIRFAKNEEGFYVPYYANSVSGSYFFLRRTLTFIENNPNKKERIKFKLRFIIEAVNEETTEWVLLEQEDVSNQKLDFESFRKEIETEKMEVYDPAVWQDYPIFEATEEMKQYHFKLD